MANSAGTTGSAIGRDITSGTTVASAGMGKLQTKSTSTFGAIKAGASAAKQSLGDMGSLITGVVGGIGLMEVAQAMWTGSTAKQFNAAYLQTKMSTSAANEYISQIQKIVADVPGDDSFMNQLLTGAVAKQTNLSSTELRALGNAAADYVTVSRSMGKTLLETQMDLKEYVLTGNTGQLERDSILKMQLDTLEGQTTVSARILALDKALKAEGYAGLSQLDIASIKMEEFKGKLQLSATTIGERILPYIERLLNYILDLDEKTGGMSSIWIVIAGSIGLAVIAFSPLIGAASAAANAIMTYQSAASKAAEKSTEASSAMSGIGKSGIIAAAGLALMVAALIGVAYYMSQANSASAAWNQAQQQRNDQVDAFANNANVLKTQESELIEKRDAAAKAGKSTFLIEEQLAAKRLEIANNTNAATDAENRWIEAHKVRQAIEDRGTVIGNQAELTGAAAAKGQTPEQYLQDTGSDPDTRNALEKTAMLWNNINAPKLKYAGTMERINKGEDTYSRKMKENQATFQQYNKDYQDYYRSSEAFFQAQEKGDIGGMIREGVMSGYFQARVGLTEMSVAFNSWAEDTGNAIKKPFTDAYVWLVSSWNGLPAWFGGLGARIGELWGEVLNYFNDPTTVGGGVYDALKKIYCIIAGCSPGLIPILGVLYLTFLRVFNAIMAPVIVVKNTLQAFLNFVIMQVTMLGSTVIAIWNMVVATVSIWIATGVNVATGAISWAVSLWNSAVGTVSGWISTGVNVATNAIKAAGDMWDWLKGKIGQGINTVVNIATGNAGSPYEIDYLYGQGSYYEQDYTPIVTSTSAAASSVSSTSNKTVIAPVFNIESISSKEEADYVIQKVTKELSDINDSKGR